MIPTRGEYSTQLTWTHVTLIKDPPIKFMGLLQIHIAEVDISFSPSQPQENTSFLTKYYSIRKATKGQAFFPNILKARKQKIVSSTQQTGLVLLSSLQNISILRVIKNDHFYYYKLQQSARNSPP